MILLHAPSTILLFLAIHAYARPLLPPYIPVVECWLKISDLQQTIYFLRSTLPDLLDADRSSTYRQYVLGNSAPEIVPAPFSSPLPSTCGPTIATVGRVTTITIESIVTLTHSCYTQTLTTKRLAGASGCPTLTNCGPHADCIIVSTQTIKVPPTDACCVATPTSLVPGPCPSCQTGCDVSVTTAYITTSPSPTALAIQQRAAEAEAQAAPTCYTTVINTDPIPTGATQTVFPVTATKTSLLNCKGCGIVTKFLNGFGPASQYKVTTTAAGKTTTVVAYSCM